MTDQDVPQWRDRPTRMGWWVVQYPCGDVEGVDLFCHYVSEDEMIDEWDLPVFGPLPSPPPQTKGDGK